MSNFRFASPSTFPPVVKNLLIINVLIFIAQITVGANNPNVENWFALHDLRSTFFHPHQLLTYMFLHGGFNHIFGNMLGLWVFGGMLENYIGSKRFLQFYILCGIGAGLLHLGVLYVEMGHYWTLLRTLSPEDQLTIISSPETYSLNNIAIPINQATLGASGAIFGCLAGAAYYMPNNVIYIYAILPLKVKWLALFYGGVELYLAIQNSAGDTVAHFAHLGGALTAIIIIWIWNKRRRRTF